jgi:hypothetical protein
MKKKFLLRINPDLWDQLERWSADEMRSVNSQIEFLLKQAVQRRRGERVSPDEQPLGPEKAEE